MKCSEVLERFAAPKALLSGALGACAYSAGRFQRRRQAAGLAPRAAGVGLLCAGASGALSWWRSAQARRHAEALLRLQRTSDALHSMVPIDSTAELLPMDEFDAATGQSAVEANEQLLKQIRAEDRARRALRSS
ncbi:unnamed protein product [Prorocentrum cordatum]|uniref:Uncharacterized protein n=1 Tax=Prorocentrum cordatum TaxID=2364126 RepID=A0ABN9Q461_9DINO|nr:unnamed protein product [Polarella glacialis]